MRFSQIAFFGPYTFFLSLLSVISNIFLYIFILKERHDNYIVKELGISHFSVSDCLYNAFALANSIYISYYYTSFIVFLSAIFTILFTYKNRKNFTFAIFLFYAISITPFFNIVFTENIFLPRYAINKACDNPASSIWLVINAILLPLIQYILLGIPEYVMTSKCQQRK